MIARPVTIGTAGHVDHGKTSLVRALTGVSTDRLPEEKRRGLSIELGFAPLRLPHQREMSIVDVPGHERFVRTMVAGATGIDAFLLVVDGGEGPRAQTIEHLHVLRLLGVEHGVVAVTKIDAVEPERVDEAASSARELVPDLDIVPVSAVTGEGLDRLVPALERAARRAAARPRNGPARLHIDRVFTLAGVGTVVTGTLASGAIARGDVLTVEPRGLSVRVRSLEVHDRAVDVAEAGQRVAVNLAGERRLGPVRGDVLVAPGAFTPGYRLDVVLDEVEPIPPRARVLVSHGTSAVPARIVHVGERYAQLRLERPVVAARGDRVVLRGSKTLGGGRVLDPHPPRALDTERLQAIDTDDAEALVAGLVDQPTRIDDVQRRTSLPADDLALHATRFAGDGTWLVPGRWLERVRADVHRDLAERGVQGVPVSTLFPRREWASCVVPLLGLEVRNGRARLPREEEPVQATAPADDLVRAVATAGLQPLRLDDREATLELERHGVAVRLGDGSVVHSEAFARARDIVVTECRDNGEISLARFRDLAGCSRRVAQLLLDRLDSERLTIRVGETRKLRRQHR